MRNKQKFNLIKRIISLIVSLALFLTSVFVDLPIISFFSSGLKNTVSASDDEETCPYSEEELNASTFDQSAEITINTTENLCKFSWWYRKYANAANPTTVNIGFNTGTTFGGSVVVFVNDNKFTSIGTEEKPFYGTIKISGTSNNLFFFKKPFFGSVEQASKIVDENGALRQIGFVRTLGYGAEETPVLYSTPVLANKIVNNKSTASSDPFKADCELITYAASGNSLFPNVTQQNTCGLVGSIESGTYAELSLTYSAPQIVVTGTGHTGLLCDEMAANSHLVARIGNTVDVTYSVESTGSGKSAGGLVGKMNSGAVLVVPSSNLDKVTQTVTAKEYAGGLVGDAVDAYIGSSEPNGSTPYTLSLADSIKTASTTLAGDSGNGYVAGHYKNTVTNRVIDFSGFSAVSSPLFTSSKEATGGLFGVLEHVPDTTVEGFAGAVLTVDGGSGVTDASDSGACHMMVSASGNNSGGLIGSYATNDLRNTLSITDVYVYFSGNGGDNVGGMIGKVDDAAAAAYISFSNINSERSSGSTGGGLIGSAGSTNAKGVFVDVQNYIKVKNSFGAGLVHSIPRGVLRLSGTTDLSGFKTGNMIASSRNTALIYSRGNGNDGTWTLVRPTANIISKDDIGTWGEVLRLTETGLTGNTVVDESNFALLHKVAIPAVSVTAATESDPAFISITSLADFAKLALNIQHNTNDTSEALTVSDSNAAALLATNITLSAGIDLRNTGIVGLTRDGGSANVSGESQSVDNLPYTGTLNGGGHTVTLAVGESYGKPTLPTEGNGKIYTHRWNGLFASLQGATVNDLTVAGVCNKKPNGGDTVDNFFGGVSAVVIGSGTNTFSSVSSTVTCNIDNGNAKNSFFGGMIGGVYSTASGSISFEGCSSAATMNDSSGNTSVHLGGYIAYVNSTTNAVEINFNAKTVTIPASGETPASTTTTPCGVGGSYTNSGHAKTRTVYGGLIGAISAGTNHTVKATVNVNNVAVDKLSITSATSSSDTDGAAGLLGYAWHDTNVNINKLDIGSGSGSTVTSTVTGGTNAAGLVYNATGHWIVKNITKYNATITTASGGNLGLLVTRGINEAAVSAEGDNSHDATSALYLEILDQRTNAAGSDNNFAIGNASVSGATGVFDEIVAFTHKKDGDITANGQNAVVSINTDGSGTPVAMTGSACNTYQNKTSFGSGKVNAHSRYYYNLDTIRAKESPSNAEKFLLWSVKTYANAKIASKFGSSFSLSSNASLDMNGLSYYTIDYAAFSDLNKNSTIKFYNKEIEDGEDGTGNSDSVVRSTTSTSAQSQHYMMHCGLFRDATATLSMGSVTLQGNVGQYDGNSGFIVSGTLGGSDTTPSAFSETALTLDGAFVNASIAAGGYAPLLLNNVRKNTTLTVNNVRSSNYTAKTGTEGWYAASSLIGKVGADDGTDTGLNVTFSSVALDARKTASSVSDATQTNRMNTAYGSTRSIFSNATLLEHYYYASNSTGTYNYRHDEDWGATGTAASAAPHLVTYGQEIVSTVDHRDTTSTPSVSEQNKYFGSDYYTSPIENNRTSTSGEYTDFSTAFKPYVYDIGSSNTDYKHELRVNIAVTNLTEGCGTYNDPYVLRTPKQFETLATLINNPGTFTSTDFQINLPNGGVTGNLQWCSNCAQEEGDTDPLGHTAFHVSGSNFTDGTTTYTKTAVSEYLAGAYYLIDGNVTLGDSHQLGMTANAFHGVIVGKNNNGVYPTITLSTGKALIDNSDGSVIKNLNFSVGQITITSISSRPSAFAYTGSCAAHGGVINKVMGGDNIIDNVGITFASTPTNTTTGTWTHTIPVGGYIGVVFNGGVFFRNMDGVANKAGIASFKESTNDKYLYRNPIIGRVLNGYAVCEDSTKLDNGDKNYYITELNSSASDKLVITSSAITAKSAQAWFVLSLLVNSGTMRKASDVNVGLYIGNNHKSTHLGAYTDVGCLNTKTSGASGTVCDNTLFTSGAAETGNVMPYLMKQYTNDGATSPVATHWLNTTTGYAITMNDSEMTAEQKKWTLDKAYRGIGGFNAYDNGSSITDINTDCNMKVASITTNSTEIVVDMQFKAYRHVSAGDSVVNYLASMDNYTTLEKGFGLFNTFIASSDLTVSDLTVSGSVFSDYYGEEDGAIYTNYGTVTYWPKPYGATISSSKRLSCGLFAGRKDDSNMLTLENCTIKIDTTGDGIHSGKNCGGYIGYAKNVELKKCAAQNVKIFGRFDTGGLLGYAEGCIISGRASDTETTKTTVTLDSITQQMRGTNTRENNKRYTGCGGLVGRTSGDIHIEYIIVTKASGKDGLITYDNRMYKNGLVYRSDDSTYMGGIVGCGNSKSKIYVDNCDVIELTINGNCECTGGVAGGGENNYYITNVTLDGKGTASILSNGKEAIGGIIGKVISETLIENVSLVNYTIHKDLLENPIGNDYYTDSKTQYYKSKQNTIGIGVGHQSAKLTFKNVFVSDCTISGECYQKVGGFVGYNESKDIVGYNLVLQNIISSMTNTNSYSQTSYGGDLIGTGSVGTNLIIVGFYRSGTPTNNMIAGNYGSFNADYSTTNKYIIFSDYNGTGIPVKNEGATTFTAGSGNVPIYNGTAQNMPEETAKSPYASYNPSLEMQGGDLYTGDAMAATVAGLAVNQIVSDMNLTTDQPTKAYTVDTANTNFAKYSSNCFSTFKREWSDAGLPDDFKDFVVLVVEDPSRDNITKMINSYAQLLTNTNYNISNYSYSGVYVVTLTKVQYDSDNNKFVSAGAANLKHDDENRFWFDDRYVDVGGTETSPTFSLIDVAFKDPTISSGTNIPVYHLYIPVVVKKMIDVDFALATGSGTPFDSQWYTDNHRYDEGKILAENIGSVGTLYFTYTYKRTQKEWQDALNHGENFLTNYSKTLLFTPASNSANLSDLPAATKLVLTDANPGRWGKEYYSTVGTAYNSTTDKLSLNSTTFAHTPSTDTFSPVNINDLLNIKAEVGGSSENIFVRDDTSAATVEAYDSSGVKHGYRLAGSGETGAYKLTVVNVAGNNTQLASSDNLYAMERYYLSIYTKTENEPEESRDTAIHYYSVTADSLEGGATKAKFEERQEKPVVFANLFSQSAVKYYTYKNPALPDYTPEEINEINNTVFVHLESTISFTAQASSTLSAQLSGVDMYQSFLVYLNNTENNKVGIYGSPSVSASITVSSVNSTVAQHTYSTADNARVVLNYAEVLTKESITNYLNNGGGAVISADLQLTYPNLANRTAQFASRSGNNTVEDGTKFTTVSAYSKIGFDSEKTALSKNQMQAILKTGDAAYQDYRYYIINRNDPALDYYALAANDGRQFGQLGINANDLPDSTGKVTVQTAAEFDARPISSLIGSCDTIKLTFTLQQKKQYSNGTFNYVEYEPLDAGRSITDYLYNVHVDLTGASTPVLDSETNTYTFTVPRSSVIPLDGKEAAVSEFVRIPITFDVFTGTDTPKDSAGNVIGSGQSFEAKGLRYANYKVVVSAQMMNGESGVGDAPSDDLVYTNAKLLTDYIQTN